MVANTQAPGRENKTATAIVEDEIRAVFDATSAAWAAGDSEAFAAHYTEDATVILPGVYLQDKAELKAAMESAFAGPLQGSRRLHSIQRIRQLTKDVAIINTRSRTAMLGENHANVDRWELGTWVILRRPGGWLLATYHGSPEAST